MNKKGFLFLILILAVGIGIANYVYQKAVRPLDEVRRSCLVDQDCVLADERVEYNKCQTMCLDVDYSLDTTISVNRSSFEQFVREESSKIKTTCNALACQPTIVNDRYKASCVNQVCTKTPL